MLSCGDMAKADRSFKYASLTHTPMLSRMSSWGPSEGIGVMGLISPKNPK